MKRGQLGFLFLFGAAVAAVLVMFIALAILPAIVGITNATGALETNSVPAKLFQYSAGIVFVGCCVYGAFVLLFRGGG